MEDIKPPRFKARINKINQLTVSSEIRSKYDLSEDDEIILEYKGKISKRVIKPKKEQGGNKK